jgi:biopolymer transport protein ExbD
MNLRRRINSEPIQLQLAPMIDVIMFLLCFFLLTWNLARYEQDLEVKVPVARNGTPPKQLPGEVIINLRSDGAVELERATLSIGQLQQKLAEISQVYPDQAVILRGAENVQYKYVVGVLDACRAAKLTNIAFATNRPEKNGAAQ